MAKKRKIRKKKISPIIQITNICKAYPDLVVDYKVKNDNYYVLLKIKPTKTSLSYMIKLEVLKAYKPRIYIVSPSPQKLFKNLKEIPHIFSRKEGRICLYYGKEITFETDYSIIIPWISEWLFYFEIWKITGKWCGGGHTIRQRDLIDV